MDVVGTRFDDASPRLTSTIALFALVMVDSNLMQKKMKNQMFSEMFTETAKILCCQLREML